MASKSYRPKQAAELLGIGTATLWRWIKERPDFPRPIRLTTSTTWSRRKHKMQTEAEKIRATYGEAETPKAKRTPISDGVVLICGGSLTPTPIAWVWEYWLAQGKLHILAGAPGQGKTTIALAFAATITSGGRWPDGCFWSCNAV